MQPVAHVSEHGSVFSTYGIGWMLFYLAFGVVLYIVDRSYLQGLYRWCYDITHKDPLNLEKSFVYGQKVSYKIVVAGVISSLETFGFLFFTTFNSNPFTELMLWLIDIPIMVIGMGIGARLYPFWVRRKKVYEAAEKFGDKIDGVADKIEKKTVGVPQTPPASTPPVAPVVPPVAPEAKVPDAPAQPKQTPEQIIANYANRR